MTESTKILLDTQNCIDRLGGNKSLYLKLLNKFNESLNSELPAFEKALSNETKEEFQSEIHSLKGVSGNLSAVALHECCSALDFSLKSDLPNKNIYDELVLIYKATRIEVAKILNII